MKNLMTASFIVITASLLCITPVISANNDDKGYISVNTTANTEVSPDVAEISFAVQTFDSKSMQKATLENKNISEKVLNELKSMINTQNGDYIKTADFSANPVYIYKDKKRVLDKYEVSNRVIVHTKSIDKVGKMIDNSIASGATNVDNLTFSVSNYEAQCNDLITIATKKAKTRAEIIARAMNSAVTGISSVTTSCSTNNYNHPRLYMAKNMMADVAAGVSAEESSTTVSGGSVKVNASVNASFFVK